MNHNTVIGVGIAAGGTIVAVMVVVVAVVIKGRGEPAVSDPAPQPTQAVVTAPKMPPPRERTLDDETTLAGAIQFVAPRAGQRTAGEHSAATILMASWAMAHLRWSDVGVADDETNFALAQKNIDDARGKRVCVPGSIIQIEESGKGDTKLSEGLIESSAGNLFHFAAVGSSGTLVQQSWARVCGVVVDKFDYENSAGGTGHATDIVGMFDLPDNRTRMLPSRGIGHDAVAVQPRASVTGNGNAIPTATLTTPPAVVTNVATPTTIVSAAPENCNPPYTIDANGHKVWKRACM